MSPSPFSQSHRTALRNEPGLGSEGATEVGISGLWLGSQVRATEPACIGRSSIRPCSLREGQPTKPTPAASSSYSTYSSPLFPPRHLDLVVAPHQNEPHAHQPGAHLPHARLWRPRRRCRPQPPSSAQPPRWSPRRHACQVRWWLPHSPQRLVCPCPTSIMRHVCPFAGASVGMAVVSNG